MKIILFCSNECTQVLTRAIENAGHFVVGSINDWQNLVFAIAQHTPHVMVSEVGYLISSPQALANVLHAFPDLPTFSAYLQLPRWEAKLLECLARPRSPAEPRSYATSNRTVYHDGELQKLSSGKLRRPDLLSKHAQSEYTRDRTRFALQLHSGRVNHAAAQHYHRCLIAQQGGLDIEIAYRQVHGSYKALSWARDLAARWLGLLAHYIHGAELDYLPTPMTPGPAVDFVHHGPPVDALHAMLQVIHFGVERPIADEIKFLVGAKFSKQTETELFQLSLRLYGFAKLLERVGEAQINLMTSWLNPNWVEDESDRTYRRHLATFRDFWRLPFVVQSPTPLRTVLAEFHSGNNVILINKSAPKFHKLPGNSQQQPKD